MPGRSFVTTFGAAATILQTVWMAARDVAKYIATRALLITCLTVILPYVLKSYFLYMIKFLETYGGSITGFFTGMMGNMVKDTPYENIINIQLNSVAGYLAEQIGFIDYCSIILAGYAIAWIINIGRIAAGAVLAGPKL